MEEISETEFNYDETLSFIIKINNLKKLQISKKSFLEKDEFGNVIYEFIPPFLQSINECKSVEEYISNFNNQLGKHLIILVQAGSAAMAIYQNGKLCQHKVITKYMTRKKRGKAQLTHLRTKGKSRVGSRIRLRESIKFFEEINQKLQEWQEDIKNCDKLLFSSTIRIWNEIFLSKVKSNLDKKDNRWEKIPLDVKVPNFKELKHVYYVLSHGKIINY